MAGQLNGKSEDDAVVFYDRKVVRDLLWAVTSPHVIDAAVHSMLPPQYGLQPVLRQASVRDWLSQLQRNPAHLLAFLQGTTPILSFERHNGPR